MIQLEPSCPRFFVAKYTPDLRRMEPRNIGVILWNDGEVVARFLGESSTSVLAKPRGIGLQSFPTYQQWIFHWRETIKRGVVISRSGQRVSIGSASFLDELASQSKPQYALVRGGGFPNSLKRGETLEALNDLFEVLVESGHEKPNDPITVVHRRSSRTLKKNAGVAIKESGLSARKDFQEPYHWVCPVGNSRQAFEFAYALHVTGPKLLIDRVPLWQPNYVHSSAFRFQCMQSSFDLAKNRCVALVYCDDEITVKEAVQNEESWKLMDAFCTVIDVADPSLASQQLNALTLSL